MMMVKKSVENLRIDATDNGNLSGTSLNRLGATLVIHRWSILNVIRTPPIKKNFPRSCDSSDRPAKIFKRQLANSI